MSDEELTPRELEELEELAIQNGVLEFQDEEVQKKVTAEVNVHKQCGVGCRQNEINEYLWNLKNPPQHINFI